MRIDETKRKRDAEVSVFMRSVARHVRGARAEKGWSQKRLAEEASVSERLVRSLEGGTANSISVIRLCSILSVLDIRLTLDDEPAPAIRCQGSEYSRLLAEAAKSWRE